MKKDGSSVAYLPDNFEDTLSSDRAVLDRLTYPSEAYLNATDQLVDVYPYVGIVTLAYVDEVIKRSDYNPNIGEASSMGELEDILDLQAYTVLRADGIHALFSGMGALATGMSMASGDTEKVKLGLEFGRRVIHQRACLAVHSLLVASTNLRSRLDIEGAGHDPLTLASNFHNRTRRSRSPLASVPKQVGARYDRLAQRLYEDDAFDNTKVSTFDHRLRRRPGFGGLLSRGVSFEERSKAHLDNMAEELRDQKTAVSAIEEVFDTYLSSPILKLTDEEMKLVGSFSSRLRQFYDTAGRFVGTLAKDPRVTAFGLLVDRVCKSSDVLYLRKDYAKTAKLVSKNEAALK